MYAFKDSPNALTLSLLLTDYPGQRGVKDDIKNFLPPDMRQQLFGDYGDTNFSNVRNNLGNAYARFQDCAEIFDTPAAQKLLERWQERWAYVKAFDGDNRQQEISRYECAKRIIDDEREALNKNCSELLAWLDNAVNLNDEAFLQKVFAVLTALAVTRGQWRAVSERLRASEFLPTLNALPDNPSLESQRAFARAKDFYLRGDVVQAEKFLEAARDETKPLWNSEIYRQAARLTKTPTDALDLYLSARACVEDALDGERNDDYRARLLKQWREISTEFLSTTLETFDRGGKDFIRDFEEVSVDARWYGDAFFKLAQFFRARDETAADEWLNRAIEAGNEEAMYARLETLWPLVDAAEEISPEAYELAERLQASAFPQIRGGAHYRLSLVAQSAAERARHLRAAYNCDFAPAVKEYNAGVVAYCEKIPREICVESGRCLLNIAAENPLAKIFAKTVPDNWMVTFAGTQEKFSDAAKVSGNEQLICLLADDDEQKNLADFLILMEMLKENPPPDSSIFVRGSQAVMPIVDTGLKQYFHAGSRPLLRVEILDDDTDAARELFAKRPLFLPLLSQAKDAATLHFVAVGKDCACLAKEAAWFMTFPAELQITTKITTLETSNANFDDELRALIAQAVKADEALYFAVDAGDDLRGLSLAIKIRTLLTRAWLKFSAAETPPVVPIGVRIKNPDFAFMSRRLIVLGEEASGGQFNSYQLTPFGSRLRYTWKNLVKNVYSRLAPLVHMIYFGVHAGKDFSDAACREAFKDFSCRTYNQRSSLAVAQSLPYRLFVTARLLDAKIFDDDLSNADEGYFFSPAARKKFLTHDAVSSLETFFKLLQKAQATLSDVWNNMNIMRSLDDWQAVATKLDGFIARGSFSTCRQAQEILDTLKACTFKQEISADKLRLLSNKLTRLKELVRSQAERVEKIFIWEHDRWSAFLKASEAWQTVTPEDATRYIRAGNNAHHQNYLAKLHPCLDLAWCHLKTLAEQLEPALGKRKDFKGYDIQSIFATGEFLSESVLREDGETPAHLRRLFCVTSDELKL